MGSEMCIRDSSWTTSLPRRRAGGDGIQLAQERIDGVGASGGVRQLFTEEFLCQRDGVLAQIVAQFGDDLLAGGLELLLAVFDDAAGLCLCVGAGFCLDLLALLAGCFADLGGFGACFSELCVVLLKSSLGLCLSGLGALNAALDPVFALCEDFLELRKNELPEEQEDDDEDNEGPDEVVVLGQEDGVSALERKVLGLLGRK